MAASLPSTIVMGLYFALLFWALIPGTLTTLPDSKKGTEDGTVKLVHAALFAVVLILTYEPVANFIHKSL
jgi:hypothetical protein